jgi:hypothetical protein
LAQSAITDVPRRNVLAKRLERGQVAECCHTSGLASGLKNHRCGQRFCAKTSEISKQNQAYAYGLKALPARPRVLL